MIDKIKLREKIRDKYQNRILEGDTKEDIAFKRGWNYALDALYWIYLKICQMTIIGYQLAKGYLNWENQARY